MLIRRRKIMPIKTLFHFSLDVIDSVTLWYIEHIVGPRPEIQRLTAHTNPPVYEVWHRSLECASVHGIGIVVLNRWMRCATKPHIITCFDAIFTKKSHDHSGYRSWFHFHLSMILLSHFEDLATLKMAARATAARAHDSKHQSNHRRTKPAAGSQINVTL